MTETNKLYAKVTGGDSSYIKLSSILIQCRYVLSSAANLHIKGVVLCYVTFIKIQQSIYKNSDVLAYHTP